MIQSVYNKTTGRYCGCTADTSQYDTEVFGFTELTPPEFEPLDNEMAFFVEGAWEIRTE